MGPFSTSLTPRRRLEHAGVFQVIGARSRTNCVPRPHRPDHTRSWRSRSPDWSRSPSRSSSNRNHYSRSRRSNCRRLSRRPRGLRPPSRNRGARIWRNDQHRRSVRRRCRHRQRDRRRHRQRGRRRHDRRRRHGAPCAGDPKHQHSTRLVLVQHRVECALLERIRPRCLMRLDQYEGAGDVIAFGNRRQGAAVLGGEP